MSIRDMTVDTFWKGEVRVQAVAEDGEGSYRTRIFIKHGEIYDYHCSCPYGSSYKGICEHGLELFKKYRLREQEMNALPVSTSPAVRAMIREYTNREVARIMGEETAPVVEFVPCLIISRRGVSLPSTIAKKRSQAERLSNSVLRAGAAAAVLFLISS